MKSIKFFKLSGSGNDFIIIDNRNKVVGKENISNFVAKVCRRKMSVGADGLILVENSDTADFKWRFFNSDGSNAEMCGNGARCVARFAYLNNIAGKEMSFETEAGIISAQITHDLVKINMPDPLDLAIEVIIRLKNRTLTASSVNTGVPHVVMLVDDLSDVDVVNLGREIRFHDMFAPAGTNVNFVLPGQDNTIAIRTYERGVEDETLACGTGAIASAVIVADKFKIKSPIHAITKGKEVLNIYYNKKEGKFYDIYLEGDARIIYEAEFLKDAWKK